MTRLTLPVICECLLLCIPLNIYVIGNNLAEGIQWALFRYQQSSLGNSLILIPKDIHYVTGGILRGSSAVSTCMWVIGAVFLVAALVMLAFAALQKNAGLVRPAGMITIVSGALFLLAEFAEYGMTLANDHGSSVPIGIPVVIVCGVWFMCGKFGTGDEGTEKAGEQPGKGAAGQDDRAG